MFMSKLLGKKVRSLRKQKGYSLYKLSRLTNSSLSYLSRLETSNSPNPTVRKVKQLAFYLDSTIEYLCEDDENLSSVAENEKLFIKLNRLNDRDKEKVEQIIDIWSRNDRVRKVFSQNTNLNLEEMECNEGE